MKEEEVKQEKYVYVSNKHNRLKIKWDTGFQDFTLNVSVDDLLEMHIEEMEMKWRILHTWL